LLSWWAPHWAISHGKSLVGLDTRKYEKPEKPKYCK